MLPDESKQPEGNSRTTSGETLGSEAQPLYFLPFAVQLQNIFPMEITAKRSPVRAVGAPSVQLSTSEIQVDTENRRAQAILEMRVEFADEPRPFEIYCKLVGQFIYVEEYDAEKVYTFLAHGSLSVMLPFARELLLSLCSRLQIPPIMLSMVQLAPPPISGGDKEADPQEM